MSPSSDTKAPEAPLDPLYKWYIIALAAWFSSFGLQTILFPYIVLYEMNASPFQAGIAQMCLMLPSLLFIPFGGWIADHIELRGYLSRLHILALFPPLIMGGLIHAGLLTYEMTLVFALTMGTLTAFCIPARDALLHSVAASNMQKGVAGSMGTQFGSQIIGVSIATLTSTVGVPVLAALQGIMVGSGALAVRKLKPAPPHPKEEQSHLFRDLAEGFSEVVTSSSLRPFCLITLGVGIFYIGVFSVGIPVFVRDVYQGDDNILALAMGAFFLGTIVSSVILMKSPGIRRVGRAYVIAISTGLAIEYSLSMVLPLWAFVFLIFLWGCGAAVAMTMGRSFVQDTARPSHRARVLSIYAMGFMGGGPIGSFLMGYFIEIYGLYDTTRFAAYAMTLLLVTVVLTTRIWKAERPVAAEPSTPT